MTPLRQKYGNTVRKNPHFQLFRHQTVPYESSREVKMSLRQQKRKRQKVNRFRLAKQQLRTCTKLFWTNFTFHRQREHATTNFSFHPQLSLTQIAFVCASQHAQKVITLSMFGRHHWAVSGAQALIPVPSPNSPTRSLKQDMEEANNAFKLRFHS